MSRWGNEPDPNYTGRYEVHALQPDFKRRARKETVRQWLSNKRTDDLRLNARTTAGDIGIKVSGSNVVLNALRSENGAVSLKAQGSIKQTIDTTTINARNIKLESANGTINLQMTNC